MEIIIKEYNFHVKECISEPSAYTPKRKNNRTKFGYEELSEMLEPTSKDIFIISNRSSD